MRVLPAWNKGLVVDDNLISQVNRLMSTGQAFTVGRVFHRLVAAGIIEGDRRSYKRFIWHLAKVHLSFWIGAPPPSSGILASIHSPCFLLRRKRYKLGGVRNKFTVGDKVRIKKQNHRTPELSLIHI